MLPNSDPLIRIVAEFDIAARDWLDKQASADQLRECKADRFAEISHRQDAKTNAEKERLARLDPEWREYREGMLHAEDEARRARFWMKKKEMLFDATRSMNANRRKEMDAGNLTT